MDQDMALEKAELVMADLLGACDQFRQILPLVSNAGPEWAWFGGSFNSIQVLVAHTHMNLVAMNKERRDKAVDTFGEPPVVDDSPSIVDPPRWKNN